MSELAGKTGGVYYSTGTIRAVTISANGSANTFGDSSSGFVTAGFVAGDKIITSGFDNAANNDTFTIAAGGVAADTLTVDEVSVVTETAGNEITIVTAPDDAQLLGFSNWTITWTTDLEETTSFEDGANGYKIYTVTLADWTATCDRYWQTALADNYDSFLQTEKWVRFFVKYVATPSGGDPAYYYEGMCNLEDISTDAPVGSVIKQSLTFQGDGPLTLQTATSAWPT